jgi:hypothetical protein
MAVWDSANSFSWIQIGKSGRDDRAAGKVAVDCTNRCSARRKTCLPLRFARALEAGRASAENQDGVVLSEPQKLAKSV